MRDTLPVLYLLLCKDEESGAGEMARLVKCLPQEHENLSLNPRTYVKRCIEPTFNLKASKAETGQSLRLAGQLV